MYYTLKQKICGGNDETDTTGIDQFKYSRSSAKSRRTVICRISVHQNPNKDPIHQNANKDEYQQEANQNTTNDNLELTKFNHCSKKGESLNTVTYL